MEFPKKKPESTGASAESPASAPGAQIAKQSSMSSFRTEVSRLVSSKLPAATVARKLKAGLQPSVGSKVSSVGRPMVQQPSASSTTSSALTSSKGPSCLYPVLKRFPGTNNPVLSRITERDYKRKEGVYRAGDAASVEQKARLAVIMKCGNPDNRIQLLGQHIVQFGKFQGESFLWLMEKTLGWVANLVADMERSQERPVDTNISRNKFLLKEFCLLFPEGRDAVKLKQRTPRTQTLSSPVSTAQPPTQYSTHSASMSFSSHITEAELVEAADKAECQLAVSEDEFPLPEGLKQSVPAVDHRWISRALFRWSLKGKPELDARKVQQLWYYPPEPSLLCSHPPKPDLYFARKLLVWMPKKMWRYRLVCPHEECQKNELTSAGIYRRVRQVLDLDGYYSLAAEYLECSSCTRKLISWSQPILDQLDLGHRLQFPVILTYKCACDVRVITVLRQRVLGNSPSQLLKMLREQHSIRWYQQAALYLTHRKPFVTGSTRGLLEAPAPEEPPVMPPLPEVNWILQVYCQDVATRVNDVQAAITSTFGTILKMDSTKKITKKLAGKAAGTATWATNVGNEYGQVLMSVLTTHEGGGLEPMIRGIQKRYLDAKVPAPVVLYLDRDCCSGKTTDMVKSQWPDTRIRLDIWHFLRRLAAGVTTESHPLYKSFMGRLSQAIFAWDRSDLDMLKEAKRAEMLSVGIPDPSDSDIFKRLSRKELALHCRRTTRGISETKRLIREVLEAFTGESSRDTLGVPLLHYDQTWEIWRQQERHVACIQDPEGVGLYMATGTLIKGGKVLTTFRCARGSTSLESFHLHLNRFIPGTSASDVHYQAYLLEGLARWNEDRAADVKKAGGGGPHSYTYNDRLVHGLNLLANDVLHHPVLSSFEIPLKYTGELIGMEYLLHQGSASHSKLLDAARLQDQAPEDMDEGYVEAQEEEAQEDMDSTVFTLASEVRPACASMQENRPSRQAYGQPPSSMGPATMGQPASAERDPSPGPSTSVDYRSSGKVHDPYPSSTVPATLGQLAAARDPSPGPSTSVDNPEESVGPHNVPGYGRVRRLASFLVFLRDREALNNQDVASVVDMYNNLHDYDKGPIAFRPRYTSEVRGRLKSKRSKSTSVTPGVISTKRCFVSTNNGPSQYPDCSRLLESITIELCAVHPADVTMQGKRVSRWTLILGSFHRIRDLVLGNARVMEKTAIQLPDINQSTLVQWHNKRVRGSEEEVLKQGLRLQPAPATAPEPTHCPVLPPTIVQPHTEEDHHHFHYPENVAGMAKAKRRKQSHPAPVTTPPGSGVVVPSGQPQPFQLQFPFGVVFPSTSNQPLPLLMPFPSGQAPVPIQPLSMPTSTAPSRHVPYATQWYRKRRLEREQAGEYVKKYQRKEGTLCGQCGKERLAHNHKQYYGVWWCQEKATQSHQEWLEEQMLKRTVKKQSKH